MMADKGEEEVIELRDGQVVVRRHGREVIVETNWNANSLEAYRAQLGQQAQVAATDANRATTSLKRLLAQRDVVRLVTDAAMMLTSGAAEDDTRDRFGAEAKIEFMVGAALSQPLTGSGPASAQDVSKTITLTSRALDDAMRALTLPPDASESAALQATGRAQLLLRFEGLLDRTEGYIEHLTRMIAAVFEPLRSECFSTLGFSPADLPKLARSIFIEGNRRFQQAMQAAQRGHGKKRASRAVRSAQTEAALAELSSRMLLFTAQELVEISGLPAAQVTAMLDALSCDPGCQPNFAAPGDANRFRRHPVVRIDDERYFIPLCWSLVHEAFAWFQECVRENKHENLEKAFLKRRDDATEELTRETLRAVYGSRRVHGPLSYSLDGKNRELDCLCDLGGVIVLAECKAHRLTDPARRGAPARIKTKAGELVLAPLEQASAAAEYMSRGRRDFKDKQSRIVTVSEAAEVLRIAVSFERIDPLSLQAALFADHSETTPGAVFCLADLLMLAELLRDPSSLTAYLVARNELAQHPAVLAYMEADLLGGFIYDRLSTVRKAAASGTFDQIDLGYSADEVNAYFGQRDVGQDPTAPETGVPPIVLAGLNKLLDVGDTAWLALLQQVFHRSPDDWQRFDELTVGTARGVAKLRGGIGRRSLSLHSPELTIEYLCRGSGDPTELLASVETMPGPALIIAECLDWEGEVAARGVVAGPSSCP